MVWTNFGSTYLTGTPSAGDPASASMFVTYVKNNLLYMGGTDGDTHTGDWKIGDSLSFTGTAPSPATSYAIWRSSASELTFNCGTGGYLWNNAGNSANRMKLYDGGGLYLGSSPSDPGANNLQVQGTATIGSTHTFNGITFSGSAANAGIELGATGSSNTPFIDFHSSGVNQDYDARLLASGGSAGIGNGTLTLTGKAAGGIAPRTTIKADAFLPATTNGATLALVTTGSDKYEYQFVDGAAVKDICISLPIPANYAGGTITFKLRWYIAGASQQVYWIVLAVGLRTGTSVNQTPTSVSTASATSNATTNFYNLTTLTWGASLPLADDQLELVIRRDPTNAWDTSTATAMLRSVIVEWGS